MSDHFILSSRVQRNLTHYERVANFHQIANPEDGAIGGGLAEVVDREAGRNSKRDDAQLPKNGDVEGDVRH